MELRSLGTAMNRDAPDPEAAHDKALERMWGRGWWGWGGSCPVQTQIPEEASLSGRITQQLPRRPRTLAWPIKVASKVTVGLPYCPVVKTPERFSRTGSIPGQSGN